jgi:hypothetical protein
VLADAAALREHRPLLRYDSRERIFASGLETMTGRFVEHGSLRTSNRLVNGEDRVLAAANPVLGPSPLTPRFLRPRRGARDERIITLGDPLVRGRRRKPRDAVYGRVARGGDGRRWLQYWLFYEDNPQDRGIARTGRHAGDWEFAQIGLGRDGRPRRVTLAQHHWAESCAWDELEHVGGGPVLYPADASHATYGESGVKDRPWPDPNDLADGRGRRVRPAVRVITRSTSWVRWPGRFGDSDESRIPGEQASPRGPAFQDDARWSDPSAYDRSAEQCDSGPPGRAWQTALMLGLPALVILLVAARRIARR